MCGLFGFSYYGHEAFKDLSTLTNALARESSIRGTDTTGIAYCKDGVFQITKEAKPAYKMTFKHADTLTALIGHTRHATQGSEKRNYNNHPFYGKTKYVKFALAHNGVLTNDDKLQKTLPKTKIETDSYVAVQLIEKQQQVSFESIRAMAEQVEGSFSFSILDDENQLYLVKGDSPLSILHFPSRKIYAFASTDTILFKALIDSPLFSDLMAKKYEQIPITEGTILKITPSGVLETSMFQYKEYYGMAWWEYGFHSNAQITVSNDEYLEEIKHCAAYEGFDPDEIDILLKEGWTLDDITEYIYSF